MTPGSTPAADGPCKECGAAATLSGDWTAANDARHGLATAGESSAGHDTVWQRFSVPYAFPVSFTHDLFATDNELLADTLARDGAGKPQRLLIFIDAGVVKAMPALPARIDAWCAARTVRLQPVSRPLVIDAGEALKTGWNSLESMRDAIHAHAIDRHSTVVAIGGGALLDAAGLVAATAHRGVRHVRIPTTVLSQNDSGVGVKNGINLYGQKNWLGTFAPPDAVINDSAFLAVLPPREQRAGMAEALKVALIRDADFFSWIEEHAVRLRAFDADTVAISVRRCARLHMRQIGQGGDPFERGSARPLDFGHWAAHRLETLSDHALRHGEAVAIGIALDTRCSVLLGLLPAGVDERVVAVLHKLGLPRWHDALQQRSPDGTLAVWRGLEDFRIHLGGELTITLLAGIGRGLEVHALPEAVVASAIDWMRQQRTNNLEAMP